MQHLPHTHTHTLEARSCAVAKTQLAGSSPPSCLVLPCPAPGPLPLPMPSQASLFNPRCDREGVSLLSGDHSCFCRATVSEREGMEGREGRGGRGCRAGRERRTLILVFSLLYFFFTLFPVLPLPSATCDRQAGGESSPIRLAPILCQVEFPPHPFGRALASQRCCSVVPANSAQSVWCMPLNLNFNSTP